MFEPMVFYHDVQTLGGGPRLTPALPCLSCISSLSFKMAKSSNRLYVKGTVQGYERSQRKQNTETSVIRLEGVQTKNETDVRSFSF